MLDAAVLQPLLDLLGDLPAQRPAAAQFPSQAQPRRLDGLFRELAKADPDPPAYEIEDLIWAIWTDDVPDAQAEMMQSAVVAIARRDHAAARAICDDLVAAYPDWAEAWNKRATLAFVEGRDDDSLRDILETLRREPRHFGALAGLGQICLRNGEPDGARIAFEACLRINPHMSAVASLLDELPALPSRPN